MSYKTSGKTNIRRNAPVRERTLPKKTKSSSKLYSFIDYNGACCSLQISSLASEDCVWLGVNEPEIRIKEGNDWLEAELPEGAIVISRMHLSKDQVVDLITKLQNFVDNDSLN